MLATAEIESPECRSAGPPLPASERLQKLPAACPSPFADGRPPRILLVDDEPINIKVRAEVPGSGRLLGVLFDVRTRRKCCR